MRDVDVVGNILSESGGIYVRSYQNLSAGYFNAIYGVSIKGNQISNTTRNWMSYINIVMTSGDGIAFGTGTIGIEVRSNTITANRPNVYSTQEEYASTEGMTARMPLESGGYYESTSIPKLLGTIFDSNTCNYLRRRRAHRNGLERHRHQQHEAPRDARALHRYVGRGQRREVDRDRRALSIRRWLCAGIRLSRRSCATSSSRPPWRRRTSAAARPSRVRSLRR